jgi:WD40 repeat protein
MNLELLQGSKDRVPDRIDATLSLPFSLSQQSVSKKKKLNKASNAVGDGPDVSARCVAFDRRGNYVAVGYSNGSVAVFDVLSRTVCALYKRNDNQDIGPTFTSAPEETRRVFLSWSRRSRSLLAGSSGDKSVRMIDATHPYGPEECVVEKKDEKDKDKGDDEPKQSPAASTEDRKRKLEIMALFGNDSNATHMTGCRVLPTKQIKSTSDFVEPKGGKRQFSFVHPSARTASKPRYPEVSFEFAKPVGGSLQVHPKDSCAGMAVLEDGSLVAFHIPVDAWEVVSGTNNPVVKIVAITNSEEFSFSSACFDSKGDRIYAATKNGELVGFEVSALFDRFPIEVDDTVSPLKPGFTIQVPGGASVLSVIVNRKANTVILNCGDGAIRLYSTKDCWTTPENMGKPALVFQDLASKPKFISCDFSHNDKYILAGSNGDDNTYFLCIWSVETGELVDKLAGAPMMINSVAWHPARSLIAVASSDGLVDLWGPRVNWTAFAPSFQALTENIEYVECEDEFDIFQGDSKKNQDETMSDGENALVDVLTVSKIASFASDSEDEEDVFAFETKVKHNIGLTANAAKES